MHQDRAQEILVRVPRALDLFPALGHGGATALIILASYPFVSPGLRQSIASLPIDPADLRRRPRANIDLVGRALALNPFRDVEEVIQRLDTESIVAVLDDRQVWNPMHLNVAVACARLVSRLCLAHGIDGTARVEDPTILHRAWQMTASLRVGVDFGPDFVVAYNRAINHLSLADPGILDRIHGNCLSPQIGRKKATSLERRYELLGLKRPVEERRIILESAAEFDEDYYLPRPTDPVDKVKAKARQYEEWEESAIPSAGGLGEIEMSRLLDALRPPYSDGAALVGMMAVAMLAPHQIHAADFRFCDGYATVETKTNRFTPLGDFDRDLHRESSPHHGRVVPMHLGEAFDRARRKLSHKECLVEMTRWIRSIIPRASLHRLASALLYQGPLWYGYPSSYAHLGLASHRPTMPGWRYYGHFDLRQHWPPVAKYLRRFDPETDWERMVPPAFACGSNCTPKDEVVQGMTVSLRNLLASALPLAPDEIVCQWNAIAALAHLLLVGHLFVRNYPMLPPPLDTVGESFTVRRDLDLINQKSPFVAWYAPPLQRLLIRLRTAWRAYAAALREVQVELDTRGNENRAYGFWSLPSQVWGRSISTYQIPRRMQCTNGLLHWPAVEKYAGIHPNAMRHWSVTTLLESGEFSLAEVNWCHGHGLASSQSLSSYRREPAFGATKRRGYDYLAQRSRLAEIV